MGALSHRTVRQLIFSGLPMILWGVSPCFVVNNTDANLRARKGGAPAAEHRAKRVRNHIARSSQRKIRGVGEQRRSLLGSNGNAEKKALGLDGTDPAYEQWLRANNSQQPPQSD